VTDPVAVVTDPVPSDPVEALAARLAVPSCDRALLVRALTHRSYAFEQPGEADSERLELLGDAVLDLAVTALLYEADPDAAEGVLSRRRALLVREASLAELARTVAIGDALRLGRGEMASGGADKDSLLADALEAVIGAVFVSRGYAEAAALVGRLLEGPLAELAGRIARGELDAEGAGGLDAKTALQERAAARGLGAPEYELEQSGPPHDPRFIATVRIDGHTLGTGAGGSKKEASQVAAAAALARAADPGSPLG
jgi:ribonuclease-3